jgi:hypothetical protein
VVSASTRPFDVASLHEATDAATASAYSIGQQLLTTVWSFVLTAVLVAAAFGRSGGKRLVEESVCAGEGAPSSGRRRLARYWGRLVTARVEPSRRA